MKYILATFKNKEFIVFLCIGVINAINGIMFSYIYSLGMNSNIAFILGYITALTISYILNSKWNFKQTLSFNRYIKFCISYIPNFCIQNIVVFIMVNILVIHHLLAYVVATVIGIPITFIFLKMYAFKIE